MLLDLCLPRREAGLALLEYVKTRDFYRKPTVVLLSSSRNEADIAAVYSGPYFWKRCNSTARIMMTPLMICCG